MSIQLQRRKQLRLPGYDYGQNGAYYVTICTYNRQNYFMNIVGAAPCGRPLMEVKPDGMLIEKWLLKTESKYENAKMDKFVIMPNHIHFIILLEGDHMGSPLPKIVDWFKTMTTNEYIQGVKKSIFPPFNKHIWQRNYFEHIIRNDEDYLRIWKYIDDNPAKWAEDEYFTES